MAPESEKNLRLEIGHVLFLDLVGYSKLLIDEQKERLRQLTDVVLATAQVREASNEKLIRLPTGDGMALVFRDSSEEPAQCALEIARAIKDHPETRVRMGIHSGPVSEVSDVNERVNIAGAGINMAQRVMDCGDAGHILLSQRVADDLAQYRQWSPHLHDLGECEVKHGVRLHVVNLYTEKLGNPEVPEKFKTAQEVTPPAQTQSVTRTRSWLVGLGIFIVVLSLIGLAFLATRRNNPASANAVTATSATEKSIAVLPFADLSQARDQEYFCDGISEEILGELAKVEGLRVVARTSSFSFKGKTMDVGEIARRLGVQNILEGSLRRDGNRVRITAQLVNARNGFHLWSQTYEREMQSVFTLQDEITRAVVDALKIRLAIAPAPHRQQDPEAYDLYLQGVFFSNKSSEEGLRKSLDFFQRSLEKDPNSARAWAGVAKAWTWLADAYVRPLDAYPAVRAAALKAVELDEREAEAHCYVADCKRVLDWDIAGNEAELKRALELDPNSGTAHLFLSLNYASNGRFEEAAVQMREALKADPLSPIISNFAVMLDLAVGQVDAAVAEGKRMQQLDPNYIYETPSLALAYREKGMFPEAIAVYKKAQEMTGLPQVGLVPTYVAIGREAEARQILGELKKLAATKYVQGEDMAAACVALGEKDEAFQWLDRAYQEHSGSLHSITVRSVFRPLYSDPRFAAILKRIGLDPVKVLQRNGVR